MTDTVIASIARTPVGAFLGAFDGVAASELGAQAMRAALERAGVDAGDVDEVILGQILTAAAGQNPARQAAMAANIPQERTAVQINQLCGSGLRAIAMAHQAVAAGDADIVVAGGQESMSEAPHAARLRAGKKMGDATLTDTMVTDGLMCAFNDCHMGNTAENIAARWQITRDDQDNFALNSQLKAANALKAGQFADEITPVTVTRRKKDTIVSQDEYPKTDTTLDSLAKLRPAFAKDGSVTAGNASGINDGAAAAVVMSERTATKRNITPIARIAAWATMGVDPAIMGTGPIPASKRALEKAGWKVDDLELVESNEAFAAQAIAVNREMGWDPAIVNVNGGAIAIGHPIGASGARVLTTLIYEMQKRQLRRGLATLCIGGGMGIAMCIERL